MSTEQIHSELARGSRQENPDEIFYHALINQHTDAYGNWTLARDRFRELSVASVLTDEQRQLAAILERYNQSRINWYKKREQLQHENRSLVDINRDLRDELTKSESERLILYEKIQAITDLETKISTRREQ